MVHLKGIKNIIFDFGGVLVDLNQQACLDAFAKLGAPQVAEYLTPYGHQGPFGQVENGDITIEQFHDEIRRVFQVSLTDQQIDEAWLAFLVHTPTYKMRMVYELAKTYRVFLLSNTNPVHTRKLKEFDEHGYPVKDCFEKLYLSYEIGLSKPGKAIYEYVLHDAGIRAEETLLVDDGPANCRTANELGIRTYQPEALEDFTGILLRPEACVATMGFFDGVHKGHQYLIDETRRVAAEQGLPSMIISFWPHPRTVLHSDFCPQLLTERDEREQLLKKTGVDYIHTMGFDAELAGLSARQFMESVLKEELHVSTLVIGFDHRFGNSRADGIEAYQTHARELGMTVVQARPVLFSEVLEPEQSPRIQIVSGKPEITTISSSLIRRLILAGDMEGACKALGYPYSLSGTVVGGHHIGSNIGYPTANIQPLSPHKLIPVAGVYAVWVDLEGKTCKGMLNIGRRPTLHAGSELVIEVHLLGFSGNLYGKILTIRFMKRFRQEEHFPDVEALVARMHKDRDYVESFLNLE